MSINWVRLKMMNTNVQLTVLHLGECVRSKCSGLKLVRLGKASQVTALGKVPKGSILLLPAPYSRTTLSKADAEQAMANGLVVLDCSWKKADIQEGTFSRLLPRLCKRGTPRALPFLMPVNPVNYGHALMLSSLEALAAALVIIGFEEQAADILEIYKWGPHFLEMNREPLEEYSKARSGKEVNEAQGLFI